MILRIAALKSMFMLYLFNRKKPRQKRYRVHYTTIFLKYQFELENYRKQRYNNPHEPYALGGNYV